MGSLKEHQQLVTMMRSCSDGRNTQRSPTLVYIVDQRVRVDEEIDAAEYEKEPNVMMVEAVAVLGFCVWGANGAGIFGWGS